MEDKHWSEEKEVIKTNRPLLFMLFLLKHIPGLLVRVLVYPISFFYFIFVPRARKEARRYQKQLKEFTNGESPEKISAFKQILSFGLCITEKMQGWLGQIEYEKVEYQNDNHEELINNLKEGKGAFIMASHLGNMELMRSLSGCCNDFAGHKVQIIAVMEVGTSKQFMKTLNGISSDVAMNVVDVAEVGPDTICYFMEEIEKGALIIVAGDRTSAHAKDKTIPHEFLGKETQFPYGAYLIPFLLKCPVYYMFGLRSKLSINNPMQHLYIEKSKIDTTCSRSEREGNIKALCSEFVEKLEKYTKKYPYQWYNFYNFWNQV